MDISTPVTHTPPMTDTPPATHDEALAHLRRGIDDPAAAFRDGQWQIIDSLVNDRTRVLAVQATGWGKSMVYFVATRLLRDRGFGPTIIVSPLLALMRNQRAAAERLCLRTIAWTSENKDDWPEFEDSLLAGNVDILLVSPERLANQQFRDRVLSRLLEQPTLFVVDEAHCISEWRHDFRPDYQRIRTLLASMPTGVPVLGTTATANDRVIEDVQHQFGAGAQVVRGPLHVAPCSYRHCRPPTSPSGSPGSRSISMSCPETGSSTCSPSATQSRLPEFTVLGRDLRLSGAGPIHPLALVDTSRADTE